MRTCLLIGDKTKTALLVKCMSTSVPGVWIYGDKWTLWDVRVNSVTRMHGNVDGVIIFYDPMVYHEYSIVDYIKYGRSFSHAKLLFIMTSCDNDTIRKCKIHGIRYKIGSDLDLDCLINDW